MAKTKFNHVIVSLSPQTAATVRDIIRAPPTGDEYKALKNALIKRNAATSPPVPAAVVTPDNTRRSQAVQTFTADATTTW